MGKKTTEKCSSLAWFSGVQEFYPALYERVSFGSDGCINYFQMPARNRMISQCHHCVPDSLGFGRNCSKSQFILKKLIGPQISGGLTAGKKCNDHKWLQLLPVLSNAGHHGQLKKRTKIMQNSCTLWFKSLLLSEKRWK